MEERVAEEPEDVDFFRFLAEGRLALGDRDASNRRMLAVNNAYGIAAVGDGDGGGELLLIGLKTLRQRSAAYRTPAAIHETPRPEADAADVFRVALGGGEAVSAAFSEDGVLLAVLCASEYDEDDLITGDELLIFGVADLIKGVNGEVASVGFLARHPLEDGGATWLTVYDHTADGCRVLVLKASGDVCVLSLPSGETDTLYDGGDNPAGSVCIAEDHGWICVGTAAGTIQVLETKTKRPMHEVPCIESSWTATHLFRISNSAILASYMQEERTNHILYELGGKDNRVQSWVLGELCFPAGAGDDEELAERIFVVTVPGWEAFVIASSLSIDVELVVRERERGRWVNYKLDDDVSVGLPLNENDDDTLPTGLALDMTCTEPVPAKDPNEAPLAPMPKLLLLTNEGLVLTYTLVDDRPDTPKATVRRPLSTPPPTVQLAPSGSPSTKGAVASPSPAASATSSTPIFPSSSARGKDAVPSPTASTTSSTPMFPTSSFSGNVGAVPRTHAGDHVIVAEQADDFVPARAQPATQDSSPFTAGGRGSLFGSKAATQAAPLFASANSETSTTSQTSARPGAGSKDASPAPARVPAGVFGSSSPAADKPAFTVPASASPGSTSAPKWNFSTPSRPSPVTSQAPTFTASATSSGGAAPRVSDVQAPPIKQQVPVAPQGPGPGTATKPRPKPVASTFGVGDAFRTDVAVKEPAQGEAAEVTEFVALISETRAEIDNMRKLADDSRGVLVRSLADAKDDLEALKRATAMAMEEQTRIRSAEQDIRSATRSLVGDMVDVDRKVTEGGLQLASSGASSGANRPLGEEAAKLDRDLQALDAEVRRTMHDVEDLLQRARRQSSAEQRRRDPARKLQTIYSALSLQGLQLKQIRSMQGALLAQVDDGAERHMLDDSSIVLFEQGTGKTKPLQPSGAEATAAGRFSGLSEDFVGALRSVALRGGRDRIGLTGELPQVPDVRAVPPRARQPRPVGSEQVRATAQAPPEVPRRPAPSAGVRGAPPVARTQPTQPAQPVQPVQPMQPAQPARAAPAPADFTSSSWRQARPQGVRAPAVVEDVADGEEEEEPSSDEGSIEELHTQGTMRNGMPPGVEMGGMPPELMMQMLLGGGLGGMFPMRSFVSEGPLADGLGGAFGGPGGPAGMGGRPSPSRAPADPMTAPVVNFDRVDIKAAFSSPGTKAGTGSAGTPSSAPKATFQTESFTFGSPSAKTKDPKAAFDGGFGSFNLGSNLSGSENSEPPPLATFGGAGGFSAGKSAFRKEGGTEAAASKTALFGQPQGGNLFGKPDTKADGTGAAASKPATFGQPQQGNLFDTPDTKADGTGTAASKPAMFGQPQQGTASVGGGSQFTFKLWNNQAEKTAPAASPAPATSETSKPAANLPPAGSETAKPTASLPPAGSETAKPTASLPPAGSEKAKPTASLPPAGSETAKPKSTLPPAGSEKAKPTASLPPAGSETAKPKSTLPPAGSETAKPTASLPPAGSETAKPTASLPPAGSEKAKPTASLPPAGSETAKPTASLPPAGSETAKPTSSLPTFERPAANASPFGSATAQPMTGTSLFGAAATQPTASATTGASLFGSQAPQPTAGTSLFGSPAQQPTAQATPFGAAADEPSDAGSPFGSSTGPAGASTPVFGAAAQKPSEAASPFGSSTGPAGASAPVFGAAAQKPSEGATPFGSSTGAAGASTPLFGAAAGGAGGQPFGSSAATSGQSTGFNFGGATTTSPFGGSGGAQAQAGTSGGNEFGSMFGSMGLGDDKSKASAEAAGSSPFGGSTSTPTQGGGGIIKFSAPAKPKSLFADAPSTAGAAGGSVFGASSGGQAGGGAAFGQSSVIGTPSGAPGSSPFGTQQGSPFGAASSPFQQQPASSAFGGGGFGTGGAAQSKPDGGMFGGGAQQTAPSPFGGGGSGFAQQQQAQPFGQPGTPGNAASGFPQQSSPFGAAPQTPAFGTATSNPLGSGFGTPSPVGFGGGGGGSTPFGGATPQQTAFGAASPIGGAVTAFGKMAAPVAFGGAPGTSGGASAGGFAALAQGHQHQHQHQQPGGFQDLASQQPSAFGQQNPSPQSGFGGGDSFTQRRL